MTDLDEMLRAAMRSTRRPADARPSLSDVRRRARRRNRRRMTAVAGSLGLVGVAATALAVRRDSPSHQVALDGGTELATTTSWAAVESSSLVQIPLSAVTPQMVWAALGAIGIQPADDAAAAAMPTPEQIGCTEDVCRSMFTYVAWNEISRMLNFSSLWVMESANPDIDFSQPPVDGQELQSSFAPVATTALPYLGTIAPTTIQVDSPTTTLLVFDGVMLIDGGAPAGAMDDAYQRLAGFNRTIVPGAGKVTDRTMVMTSGVGNLAAAAGAALNVGGVDPWDPSFFGAPIQGIAAVIIGPDYWDLVPTATTTTVEGGAATTTGP